MRYIFVPILQIQYVPWIWSRKLPNSSKSLNNVTANLSFASGDDDDDDDDDDDSLVPMAIPRLVLVLGRKNWP